MSFSKTQIFMPSLYATAEYKKSDLNQAIGFAWYRAKNEGEKRYVYEGYHSYHVTSQEPDDSHFEVTPVGFGYRKEKVN